MTELDLSAFPAVDVDQWSILALQDALLEETDYQQFMSFAATLGEIVAKVEVGVDIRAAEDR